MRFTFSKKPAELARLVVRVQYQALVSIMPAGLQSQAVGCRMNKSSRRGSDSWSDEFVCGLDRIMVSPRIARPMICALTPALELNEEKSEAFSGAGMPFTSPLP